MPGETVAGYWPVTRARCPWWPPASGQTRRSRESPPRTRRVRANIQTNRRSDLLQRVSHDEFNVAPPENVYKSQKNTQTSTERTRITAAVDAIVRTYRRHASNLKHGRLVTAAKRYTHRRKMRFVSACFNDHAKRIHPGHRRRPVYFLAPVGRRCLCRPLFRPILNIAD